MKPKRYFPYSSTNPVTLLAVLVMSLSAAGNAFSASATWNGTSNATWADGTNWSASPAPGSGETATFSNAGNANTAIDLGAGVTVGSVVFDTATVAAYTIGTGAAGSQTLTLGGTGAITMNATVVTNQLINANLNLGSAAGAEPFTLGNLKTTTNTLTVAGAISTTQTGVKTLTVNSVGLTNISGAISDGSGTVSLNKTGANLLTLSGTNSYSGGTLISGILNAANSSALGSAGVTVNAGTGNQLQLGSGVNLANAVTVNGGGIVGQGVIYLPTGNASISGPINFAAVQNSGGHLSTAGYVNNTLTIAGDNTITSAVPITIRNGRIHITGAQNYTGGTTMNGASLIQFGKIASMPATGTVTTVANGTIVINAGGVGEFTPGTGAGTIGGLLTGTGGQGAPVTWINGASMGIDTSNAAGTVTQTSALTPAFTVGLLKLGTGTLELTGGGTYAGNGSAGFPFVTRQGTLLLNGGTHNVTGEAVIGGLFGTANGSAGFDATLQIDAGSLGVTGYLSLGRGNGIGVTTSNLIANNAATISAANFSAGFNVAGSNLPKGSVTMGGTSSFTVTGNGVFNFAESAGSNMTMTLNDSAQVIATGTGAKTIGNGGLGTIVLNGASSINFGGVTTIGNSAGAIGSSVTRSGTGSLTLGGNAVVGNTASNATLTLNNTSSTSVAGITYIGNTGGTGNLNLNGAALLGTTGITYVGYNTGTGIMTMVGGTWTASADVRVGGSDINGTGPNGSGTMTISGGTANLSSLTVARGNNNQNTVSGNVTVNSGTLNSANDLILGFAGNNNLGKLTISGGTVNVGSAGIKWLSLGLYDTSRGQLDITSGSLNLLNQTALKFSSGNTGTAGPNVINQSGGFVTFFSDAGTTIGGNGDLNLQQSGSAATNNTYNLSGGVLTVPQVGSTLTTGTRTFNFDGGTLKAAKANPTFFNLGAGNARANVRNGGAIIHSDIHNVAIAQALLHSNIDGDNAIDGGLRKQGSGALSLSAANTYTGPTLISGGTLTLAAGGSIDTSSGININGSDAKLLKPVNNTLSSPVTLTQGSLDGSGTINNLTVASAVGNTISTGNGDALPLTVGTLTFNGAATLNMRANGTTMEQYILADTLVTNGGAGEIVINLTNTLGAWVNGQYILVDTLAYSGTDASKFSLAGGTVPGLASNQNAELIKSGDYIMLNITSESLVWTGNTNSNWDDSTANWEFESNPFAFSAGEGVTFNDSATSYSVILTENVSPAAIVFDNNGSNDYLISGSFGITSGSIVKNGNAKVTITTNNSFTGSTTIAAGTLEIGNGSTAGSSIAASSSIANNGNLIFNLVGSPNVYGNPITGSGSITKTGSGALTLAGANTFTGSFTLDAGVLNFNSASALGTGDGIITMNGGNIDNTSGAPVVSTSNKPQAWNTDITFTGSNDLDMGAGAVTLGGSGSTRTVNVIASTFGVGGINGFDFGLVKTGAGHLRLNGVSNITGTLDIQNGIVSLSQDFTGAAPIGTGILQNSGLTATKWTFWNGNTDFTSDVLIRNNDGTGIRQLGIVKLGTGSLTLTNNANNATANLSVESGRIVLNNTGTYGARFDEGTTNTNLTSVVGNTAGENGVLEINGATVTYNNRSNAALDPWRSTLNIGNNGTGAGALKLVSGSLSTNKQLTIGGATGAFGAMTQTGGSTTVGGFLAVGLGASYGVLNLNGGTYNQEGPATNAANTGSIGVINIGGDANYNQTSTGDNGLWIGENGRGILNVSGTSSLSIVSGNNGLQVARGASAIGTVNLLGGTVTAKAVYKGAGFATLNFNGGTLAANIANTAFLTGLDAAYVHAGGGTVNNGGNAITIGQALLAPTGNGVTQTGLSVSGSGLIATPIVEISGDGTGATAVANIDASGNLTGVTITNPGVGYTFASAILTGGGIGNTGDITGSADTVPNVSGGMTFTGAAITTLAGVNTYTGNTTVNSGSTMLLADNAGLKFVIGANGVSNKVTGAGNAYIYGDFTIDLTGAAIANGNNWTLVDTSVKTFDPISFTVAGFNEIAIGVHERIEGNNTWTFTESDGKLSLAVSAPAGFESWISGFGTLPLDQRDPEDDFDADGLKNILEYVLGGNPTVSSSAVAPTGSKSGTNFIVSFSRSDLSESDALLSLEYGNDLVGWTTVAVPAGSGTVGAVSFSIDEGTPITDPDLVTATIPTSGATKFFARIKAVK